MEDKTIEFAKNIATRFSNNTSDCNTVALAWIDTFSEMIPDTVFPECSLTSGYVDMCTALILKTKCEPDSELISKLKNSLSHHLDLTRDKIYDYHPPAQVKLERFVITWIETFSELPPTEIMNVLYNGLRYAGYLDLAFIGERFITKTKTKPPTEFMTKLTYFVVNLVPGKFITAWIETFSELPPAEFMAAVYAVANVSYIAISVTFIRNTKTKPDPNLMSRMLVDIKHNTYDSSELDTFVESWIGTFSELPPTEFMNIVYSDVYCIWAALAFIRDAKTKPDPNLMSHVIVSIERGYYNSSFELETFIESWIETFSELPPTEFMDLVYSKLISIHFVSKFILKTKTKPDPKLMKYIIEIMNYNIIIAEQDLCEVRELWELWVKTFSELPPTEICEAMK